MKNTSTKTTIAYLRTRKLLVICSFLLASTLGRAQSAIEFHGGGAYAELGTVSPAGNFSSGLTIECWVKWDAFNTWSRIIDFGNGAGDDNILFANESNGSNLRFEVYNEGSQLGVSSPVEMVTGRWYHVAVTQTPDGLATIYIDGNPVASETIFTPFDVARTQCYIGKSGWDGDGYFQGKIDELRIWNTARTHSEIRKHMLKPVAVNASGLVGYYRFNENSGMTTANSGTNGGAGNGNFVDGLAWTSSPVQQAPNAITFDGIDDHMAIGSPLTAGNSYTKEAWIFVTKNSFVPQNIISSNASPFWIDGGSIRGGNDGSYPELTDPSPVPMNTWVHVALTYDAGTNMLRLYRDGLQVDAGMSFLPYAGDMMYVGAWHNGMTTESYFGGKIDEVRIWNRARAQHEIIADMNRELDADSQVGLVSSYNFNQGISGGDNSGMVTVSDQKGTFNGVLTNILLNGATSNFTGQQNSIVILPVRFGSFTLQKQQHNVVVKWSTTAEASAMDFTVEHGTDGIHWNSIAVIPAWGNSNQVRHYSHVHTSPSKGINYYRIVERDTDGRKEATAIKTISLDHAGKAFVVQNNIVTNQEIRVQVSRSMSFTLYSAEGKKVWTGELATGLQTVQLPQLGRGIYFLHAEGMSEKIMVR